MEDQRIEQKREDEGGCGVIGIACAEKVAGRHLLSALTQMRNRGNGKGGGIAAVGLKAEQFHVTEEILDRDYLLSIAYLDLQAQEAVEKNFIYSVFEVDRVYEMPHLDDYRSISDLEVRPPDVFVYFVRVKPEAIQAFNESNPMANASKEEIEGEFVYRNSDKLNRAFYSSTGEKKAFVLSHGKNLLVLKMVGFGDDVVRYYKLEDLQAHIWIGHHRYPTKGKVWHPGGAHPFIGLNEALVHNGDFANYYSLCEYLAQRKIYPLFLTDTEVAALIFDLLNRTYRYPLEYVIEAFAPTTERDFTLLPEEKQQIYSKIQKTHMHNSPDGPWFFLIAQSLLTRKQKPCYRLIGITDTSMLRPQVFALQKGQVSIGLAASEKQAIDATLTSLSNEDPRFWSRADYMWNARGGSYTDGGAFIFTVTPEGAAGHAKLECQDKFGNMIHQEPEKPPFTSLNSTASFDYPNLEAKELFQWAKGQMPGWSYSQAAQVFNALSQKADKTSLEVLTSLLDQYYPIGEKRRSCLLSLLDQSLKRFMEAISLKKNAAYAFTRYGLSANPPENLNQAIVIDAKDYPAEGLKSLALEIRHLYHLGYRKFIIFQCRGQRFIANGLGPNGFNVRIDVYGSSGDYLGSGIDGEEVYVHGSAQDQLGQIMKQGKLVIHGDVGQTFMYGAKGGKAFVRGNAAGRPLINAVGKPRVVINGTCLDYLAESFMAGNPLKDGGFVILNGIFCDAEGKISDLPTPYPGSNLFSLSSGGAIYIRDPAQRVTKAQVNGGEFVAMTDQDADLIMPYLKENEELFHIPVSRLLEHSGNARSINSIYRKIAPSHHHALQQEEAWVKGI